MLSYIHDTALPTIPTTEAGELDAPFSDTELLQVIKGLKNGKSPGPDGFSPCFYETFAPL